MLLGFLAIVGLAAALILFHASLMPLLIDPRQLAVGGVLAILAIIFLVTVVVMSGYPFIAGRRAHRLRTPERSD